MSDDKDAEIARLNARVAELEKALRWRPVSEAPRDVDVLWWSPGMDGPIICPVFDGKSDGALWLPVPLPPALTAKED